MLEKILKVMKEGRRITLEELAEECGTTPAMLSAMMENLVRQGRLKKGTFSAKSVEDNACAHYSGTGGTAHPNAGQLACRGCSGNCGCCQTESIMDFFELTEAESEI